ATQHELLERANLAQVVRLCRPKDATSQVANDPVGLAPVAGVPNRAVSSRGSVCSTGVLHLTCPLVSVLQVVLWVTHPTHVSGLSAQAKRPYPPGYDFPVPYGGWPSLLGSSCARCGIGPSFRRSSGLLAAGPDRNGVAMFRTRETRRGRVPSVLRGLGVRGGSGGGPPPLAPSSPWLPTIAFRPPPLTPPHPT